MSERKSRTLELLAFDEKFTFDYFCLIWAYKTSLALYAQIKQKQSKVDFSSKAKSSNVRYFLSTKYTVHTYRRSRRGDSSRKFTACQAEPPKRRF